MLPAQNSDTLRSALACNIATLLEDSASSDVVIRAGNTTVHAHKTILAAQLPTFRAMFQASTVHANPASFLSCILAHVFLDTPPALLGMACQLLRHSDITGMHSLQRLCLVQARKHFCMNHTTAILASSVWVHSSNVANTRFVAVWNA